MGGKWSQGPLHEQTLHFGVKKNYASQVKTAPVAKHLGVNQNAQGRNNWVKGAGKWVKSQGSYGIFQGARKWVIVPSGSDNSSLMVR